MQNPVVISDGHTYEQASIERWLLNNDKSPMTGEYLSNVEITPNYTLRSAIQAYKERKRTWFMKQSRPSVMFGPPMATSAPPLPQTTPVDHKAKVLAEAYAILRAGERVTKYGRRTGAAKKLRVCLTEDHALVFVSPDAESMASAGGHAGADGGDRQRRTSSVMNALATIRRRGSSGASSRDTAMAMVLAGAGADAGAGGAMAKVLKKSIPVDGIVGVITGKQTPGFRKRRACKKVYETSCLSLMTAERSYDIAFQSELDRNVWAKALHHVIAARAEELGHEAQAAE
eukprot:GFYU01005375.1.p1 GENE.GFYU01005375.1~~GFYU01005375.1.p1  ORF type:complete len:331 (-),score=94.93 GFYU01005375.1:283-1143(-)